MVGIIKFFKREDHKWYRLDQILKYSFLKIRDDIQNVFLWLHHFKEKHEHNEQQHFVFNEELRYHKSMISHLNEKLKNLKNEFKTIKTEKGQVRTPERTFKGQVKDMSFVKKDISKGQETEKKVAIFDPNTLVGSHIELLNLMYHSDKPLGYKDIARILGKKEKSVRNLIYELRQKRVTIRDKPIGIRVKGFYLPSEEKIKVSGR